jgi:hypothetical protein
MVGVSVSLSAHALDKQGSAHGGAVEGENSGFDVSGDLGLGVAFYNPTYAARPDNTGLALMRYTLHADVDLIGRRLSIPIDINVFSDRTRRGGLIFAPSELDFIGGVTSTWGVGPGALELGIRAETDRNVDRGNYSQTYVDARTRYLFALGDYVDGLKHALGGGDISGAVTLGLFAVNPTYAARPDNSGKALLRYGLHTEISFWDGHAAIGLDGTMFTDREASGVVPSELDVTPSLTGRFEPFQLQIAYERDTTIDGRGSNPGYTQSFAYAMAGWAFDLVTAQAPIAPADAAPPLSSDEPASTNPSVH